MDQIDTTTAVREPSRRRLGLDRLRLRFRDPALESAFRADQFRHQLGNIRFAFLVGIVLWISWGLLLRPTSWPYPNSGSTGSCGGACSSRSSSSVSCSRSRPSSPDLGMGRGRHRDGHDRLVGVLHLEHPDAPSEYGYVGVILITAFTYTLLRLRFVLVLLITLIGIGAYLPYAFSPLGTSRP
jgi:hypothetical protein